MVDGEDGWRSGGGGRMKQVNYSVSLLCLKYQISQTLSGKLS